VPIYNPFRSAACPGIANSNNVDVTCTSALDAQANLPGFTCGVGFYLDNQTAPAADACRPCSSIANSNNVSVTCTTALDSQAGVGLLCNDGYYLVDNAAPAPDVCAPCGVIANSNNVNVTCTTGRNSRGDPLAGFKCDLGYAGVASKGKIFECKPCPSIPNSNDVSRYCVDDTFVCSCHCLFREQVNLGAN
jgi:hypothetical protein